jgi:hypothetical protein
VGSLDKRIELFRRAAAAALKEINGATIEYVSDFEKLVEERLRERAGFCRNAGAVAELDSSEAFAAVAIVTIFCDELETEVYIPLKLVADTEDIDERHIEVEVGDW